MLNFDIPCSRFIYFQQLCGRSLSLYYTPQHQYLKAVFIFCPRIMNVSQYFIQKLPCPSNRHSVGIHFIFSFKEMQIILIKSKRCL